MQVHYPDRTRVLAPSGHAFAIREIIRPPDAVAYLTASRNTLQMIDSKPSQKYVAFLRGINVGGHHKVPMASLRELLPSWGLVNVTTLLNSGNIIFEADDTDSGSLESLLSDQLEKNFEFRIPTVVLRASELQELHTSAPFDGVTRSKDIRLYVSFLKRNEPIDLELPWQSDDQSFEILAQRDRTIFSVLDLSVTNTPKGMEALEKFYGKDITTRNWKTIERIMTKL